MFSLFPTPVGMNPNRKRCAVRTLHFLRFVKMKPKQFSTSKRHLSGPKRFVQARFGKRNFFSGSRYRAFASASLYGIVQTQSYLEIIFCSILRQNRLGLEMGDIGLQALNMLIPIMSFNGAWRAFDKFRQGCK
jgi:hypothetical protein